MGWREEHNHLRGDFRGNKQPVYNSVDKSVDNYRKRSNTAGFGEGLHPMEGEGNTIPCGGYKIEGSQSTLKTL